MLIAALLLTYLQMLPQFESWGARAGMRLGQKVRATRMRVLADTLFRVARCATSSACNYSNRKAKLFRAKAKDLLRFRFKESYINFTESESFTYCPSGIEINGLHSVLVRLAERLGAKQSLIDAMQPLRHPRTQQFVVVDLAQVIRNEPDRLVTGHPLQVIEPR